jgi:hypothetical protein
MMQSSQKQIAIHGQENSERIETTKKHTIN